MDLEQLEKLNDLKQKGIITLALLYSIHYY